MSFRENSVCASLAKHLESRNEGEKRVATIDEIEVVLESSLASITSGVSDAAKSIGVKLADGQAEMLTKAILGI